MWKCNSAKLSLFCFYEWYSLLSQRVILSQRDSDILFALKARNAHTVSGRISLGVSRISLRSNRTRQRRIELAWYSDKSITPCRGSFMKLTVELVEPVEESSRVHLVVDFCGNCSGFVNPVKAELTSFVPECFVECDDSCLTNVVSGVDFLGLTHPFSSQRKELWVRTFRFRRTGTPCRA